MWKGFIVKNFGELKFNIIVLECKNFLFLEI